MADFGFEKFGWFEDDNGDYCIGVVKGGGGYCFAMGIETKEIAQWVCDVLNSKIKNNACSDN